MTDQPTPRPWPEGTVPTAAALLPWVRTATDDEVLIMLNSLLEDHWTAHRCVMADHDRGMHDLHTRTADATRWAITRDTARAAVEDDPMPDHTIAAKVLDLLKGDDTP